MEAARLGIDRSPSEKTASLHCFLSCVVFSASYFWGCLALLPSLSLFLSVLLVLSPCDQLLCRRSWWILGNRADGGLPSAFPVPWDVIFSPSSLYLLTRLKEREIRAQSRVKIDSIHIPAPWGFVEKVVFDWAKKGWSFFVFKFIIFLASASCPRWIFLIAQLVVRLVCVRMYNVYVLWGVCLIACLLACCPKGLVRWAANWDEWALTDVIEGPFGTYAQ